MTGKLCFWAILSTSDLKFIYFSPSLAKLLGIPPNVVPEALQGRALWEFIHPEEYAMARDDLKKFMETKNIGGSVTRCRLIDLDDIIEHKVVRRSSSEIDIPIKIQPRPLDRRRSFDGGPNWEVVDIVMYLVTDQIILTFFHADYEVGLPSGAGSLPLICQEVDFTLKDGKEMMSLLHSISPADAGVTRPGSVRIFQIIETETKKILVTWPPATDKSRDAIQLSDVCLSQMLVDLIDKNAQRNIDPKHLHPYENATCVHQAQVYNQVVHESGQAKKVESIVVQYGSVTFGSFDVSCLDQTVPTRTSSLETVTTTISFANNPPITPSSVLTSSPPPVIHGLQQRSSIAASELDTRIPQRDNDSVMFTPMSADSRTAPSTSVWNANIQLNLGDSPISSARVVCESCHTDSSPEWRKGPTGQKTLCNACGLRYARSVAKQDSFGRRQRGVRVVINNDPQYKYPKSPSSMQNDRGSPSHTQYTDDVPVKFHENQSDYSELNDQHPSTASETAASRNKQRKKSRYLPIGDNRAGARTRAARKARMMQPDNEQVLTHEESPM